MSTERVEDRAFEAWKEYDQIADHDNMTRYQYFLEGWRGGENARTVDPETGGPDIVGIMLDEAREIAEVARLARDKSLSQSVPEPSSLVLWLVGIVCVYFARKIR